MPIDEVKCSRIRRVGKWNGWMWGIIGGGELEIYLEGIPHGMNIEAGGVYEVEITVRPYTMEIMNIQQKLIKKISTHPYYPTYVLMGEVKEINREKGKFVIDSSLEIEVYGLSVKYVYEKLRIGDYVALSGIMFGRIHTN